MCMADGGEAPEVYRDKMVKARKMYKCEECRRGIAIGEAYLYAFMVYEGYPGTYRVCSHCYVATRWLAKNCGGFLFSAVTDDIKEHATEYRYLALPLYRLVVGAGRKWKRFGSDALMPIPKLPPPIAA